MTPEQQKRPWDALDAIGMTIKAEEQFWHFQDELLSNVCEFPNDGIHAMSTYIAPLSPSANLPTPNPGDA